MDFVPLTEEQKLKAAQVDLKQFCDEHNIEVERSGSEYRLVDDPYITIRGNQWFDQGDGIGGNPVSFVRRHYSLEYPNAVLFLLGDKNYDDSYFSAGRDEQLNEDTIQQKPFELPERSVNMKRMYAYLIQRRFIPPPIVSAFTKAGTLYEGVDRPKPGQEWHHAIFVGEDENGVAKHAHKHGLNKKQGDYRGNVASSKPAHSFHHNGNSDRLYVFEAPIDMLSFIGLFQAGWQQHNYVALCGVSHWALIHQLASHSNIKNVFLCLDNDERGMQATEKLAKMLSGHQELSTWYLVPKYKDWNDDLKEQVTGVAPSYVKEHTEQALKPSLEQMNFA